MKKIFLGLVALMVSVTLMAERVTVEDAALVANNFMNVASAPGVKKATPAKRMVHKAVAEENLYYIYQNADGEGWVIVAADDAVMPILAYSETGTFRTDNMPVNIRKWMGKYNNFIRKIEDDGVVASTETQAEWKALRNGARKATAAAVVGPLVKTTWDQGSPYDLLTPGTGTWGEESTKAATGCVATAMAQVMKYWEWPIQGTGSHSYTPLNPNTGKSQSKYGTQSADFGNTTYDWTHMKNSYSGTYTDAEATAVATLMYHCGVATEMMYGDFEWNGSGTYTVNYGDEEDHACAQNALWMNFGYKKSTLTGYMRDGLTYQGTQYYKKWSDTEWTAMIKEELDKQHPIMYGGAGDKGGHSFICDGYDTSNMFHFNWGWSGSNDGYYTLSNLVPGSGGAGGGDYDFSEDQDVLIGIVPDKKDLPKVNVTWSVDGVTTVQEFTQEDALVLPTDPADCTCGKKFVGWTAQSSITGGAKPDDLFKTATGKTVTAAITYYAVFAEQEGEGGASFDGTSSGAFKLYANVNGTKYYATTVSNNKVQSTTDEASATTFTFTTVNGGFTISDGTSYLKHGSGTNISASNTAYTWTISAGEHGTWRINSQTNGRALLFRESTYKVFGGYATSNANGTEYFDVEIGDSNTATYSNYTLNCNCSGTAVENTEVAPKAVKIMENGQIIILRDNEKYTIFGQKIQ